MIEKRNRTAEDQVRKIAFSKYDRQIFEEKNTIGDGGSTAL